jgi:hypothetical protein
MFQVGPHRFVAGDLITPKPEFSGLIAIYHYSQTQIGVTRNTVEHVSSGEVCLVIAPRGNLSTLVITPRGIVGWVPTGFFELA